MKKFILILLTIVAFNAQAQTTLFKQSASVGDSIVIVKGAVEIEPVIASAQGDTARSISFSAFNVTPDTAQGCQTYVQLYDAYGKSIGAFNQPIPASVKNVWGTDDSVIYDYIFLMNPRFKKVVPTKKN